MERLSIAYCRLLHNTEPHATPAAVLGQPRSRAWLIVWVMVAMVAAGCLSLSGFLSELGPGHLDVSRMMILSIRCVYPTDIRYLVRAVPRRS